ncbi:DUF2254 domain-containing protein [Phycicoccus endophyticus]|uniref:DUF2254 domain-containing protein n=1 Tax=Phycicoccus endophyticus TaxID=1690220 RepID=A0A7G9QYG5_9MICO|nr:DUF2254 domain-containing protein [Phycicoccus endophyticus]NHI19287.1 DUF2254 domain-containing protein [Phycicoccus endophyticus]QNN48390.1 DUF2254 domain-containing protein [Phycicoccus endophyticus]GGL41533.1 hypothetical protein GCM10012283_25220 [Phycicoccus endophyticus]
MSGDDEVGPGSIRRTVGPLGDPETVGWWESLWRPFWVLPAVVVAASVLAGVLVPLADEHLLQDVEPLFGGNADSARSLLGTIASAMISVTGLVFSITMVVMQLASSQFTPRLLGTFLGSRIVQVTLGVFISSFVFALMVLRDVRGGEAQFVPQLSVTLAFGLVLASVALFIAFIHHITDSIQVDRVVDRIAGYTVRSLERGPATEWDDTSAVPPSWSQAPGPSVTVTTGERHGVVQRVHYSALVRAAQRAGAVVELRTRPGQVRHRGQQLAVVHGAHAGDDVVEAVRDAFGLGRERTLQQDPEFGLRQLVDIAERALSPGVNDPTTAVQVLDELHRILRVAAVRPDRSAHLVDGDGTVRVLDRPPTFAGMLDLSLDEIAHYGRDTLQVPARVDALLEDVEAMARPEHAATVAAKRAALRAGQAGGPGPGERASGR